MSLRMLLLVPRPSITGCALFVQPCTTTAALSPKARRGRRCTRLQVQGAFVPSGNKGEATIDALPIDDKITEGHVNPGSQNPLWGSSGIQRGMAVYML